MNFWGGGIDSLIITNNPKTVYNIGDRLDLTGLKLISFSPLLGTKITDSGKEISIYKTFPTNGSILTENDNVVTIYHNILENGFVIGTLIGYLPIIVNKYDPSKIDRMYNEIITIHNKLDKQLNKEALSVSDISVFAKETKYYNRYQLEPGGSVTNTWPDYSLEKLGHYLDINGTTFAYADILQTIGIRIKGVEFIGSITELTGDDARWCYNNGSSNLYIFRYVYITKSSINIKPPTLLRGVKFEYKGNKITIINGHVSIE